MQIMLSTFTMHLEDEPLDIGYASEKVVVADIDDNAVEIGGHNGKTQLILTAPFIDDALIEEYKEIVNSLPKDDQYEITTSIVVANKTHRNPNSEGVNFLVDKEKEFGDFYGVSLVGEPCHGELTKAAILVSKDGAVFYDEFAENLHDKFNIQMLLHKVVAAQNCYTGKGCH